MNHYKKGKDRDRKILEEVSERRYLTRSQIQRLLFNDIKDYDSAMKKANNRLLKLVQKKELNRSRIWDFNTQYLYYIGTRHENWQQYVWTNEVYTQLRSRLVYFKNEYAFEDIRADGIGLLKTGEKTGFWFFVEIDRSTKAPTEIAKYNDLFEKDSWLNTKWGKHRHFSRVLIVTNRVNKYQEQENKNRLKFIYATFSEIEGMKWISRLLEG